MLAGTRSGKTCWAPYWLWREIKQKGPGDYLLCAPSYKLLDKAAVPYLNDAFAVKLQLGKLIGGSQGRFEISKAGEWQLWQAKQEVPTRIVFGHADEPESLEAAQYKAAVCDEAGQKRFRQESWEAIQRRLAIDQGRSLFVTTPYSLNWLKTDIYDRAVRNRHGRAQYADEDYECVSFESIMNPAFPLEEWERAKATLPDWKFDLFFRGIFSRPAGAIYDCFELHIHVVPSAVIPADWPRTIGIDFGAPNFAACFIAEEKVDGKKTGRRVVYAEYRPTSPATIKAHIEAMRAIETKLRRQWGQNAIPPTWRPDVCVGGAKSEGQWRNEANACGWPIQPPDTPEVEVQIDRVYSAFKLERLFISEACPRLTHEVQNYSRVVDEAGNALNDIEDKEIWHGADSLRYPISWLDRRGLDFHFRVI